MHSFTIRHRNGTEYSCRSNDPNKIIQWVGWFIETDTGAEVSITGGDEVALFSRPGPPSSDPYAGGIPSVPA